MYIVSATGVSFTRGLLFNPKISLTRGNKVRLNKCGSKTSDLLSCGRSRSPSSFFSQNHNTDSPYNAHALNPILAGVFYYSGIMSSILSCDCIFRDAVHYLVAR